VTETELERLYVWCIASIRKALAFRVTESLNAQMPVYFEADLITDTDRKTHPERIEFRIDGPTEMSRQKSQRGYKVELNAYVHSTRNESDLFKHQKNVAIAVRCLGKDIQVFKYGFPDSDKSLVGCFQLVDTRGDLVVVTEHGQIDSTSKIQLATVEAHFEMFLDF
jgi:hypothetical protein